MVEAEAGLGPGAVALVVAAPLLTGDVELFFLNLVGLGIGALLLRRFMPRRPVGRVRLAADDGASGSLIPIPTRKGPSPIRGRPFFFARKRAQIEGNQGNKAQALRRCTMTTATLATGNRSMDTVDRPRRSLEELVDQLMAAMFKEEEPETASGAERGALVHEARRLRQAGDVDGALAVLAGVDAGEAETRRPGGPSPSGQQLVKRRFGGRDALVYSQGAGRAAALVPGGDGGTLEVAAVLGMRWRPGKVVSRRSLRGLRPLTGGA